MTLEEIDSAETLASNLEKIELPDHIVAVLVDPLLQKFMMLKPDSDFKRAASWMDVQMAEILNGDADHDTVTSTLNTIREYSRSTKVGNPRPLYVYPVTADMDIDRISHPFLSDLFVSLKDASICGPGHLPFSISWHTRHC